MNFIKEKIKDIKYNKTFKKIDEDLDIFDIFHSD